MEETKKESKGAEYYKGYAAGYRDAVKELAFILKPYTPIPYVPMKDPKEWWDSPPM